jgi:hypothetical protein
MHLQALCGLHFNSFRIRLPARSLFLLFCSTYTSTPFPLGLLFPLSTFSPCLFLSSVPDPDPDPPDPHVFGPPGSGSISQRYGSGSGSGSGTGSFNQQAKIVRKSLILTVLCLLLDFLFLKNYVNVPSKSN